jgi:broad specificity phosphatase PhoE
VRPYARRVANALYVLRHGETSWSRDRRHTGWTDIPLTDAGRLSAEHAGATLRQLREGRPWAAAVASPLSRALDTARLAGVDVTCDDRLREWNYGRYEGVTTDVIREQRPGWDLWRDGCPDGEFAAEVGARVDGVLDEVVVPALASGDVLLVSHSHLLRVLAARWLELGPDGGRLFVLDPAGIGILGHEHGRRVLLGWNIPSA